MFFYDFFLLLCLYLYIFLVLIVFTFLPLFHFFPILPFLYLFIPFFPLSLISSSSLSFFLHISISLPLNLFFYSILSSSFLPSSSHHYLLSFIPSSLFPSFLLSSPALPPFLPSSPALPPSFLPTFLPHFAPPPAFGQRG